MSEAPAIERRPAAPAAGVGREPGGGAARPGVRVKICGVTRIDDARAAAAAGADMIGFNFWPQSRRSVTVESAAAMAAALPAAVWRVGVFVDASRAEISLAVSAVGLAAIQLHGDEPAELLRGFAVPVIRAVRLRSALDAERARDSLDPDFFLCEGASDAGPGGVGAAFDWSWARALPAERLFVAGGLTPENVAQAVRALRPFAVDVASGVERSPGIKEAARVAAFIDRAKAA